MGDFRTAAPLSDLPEGSLLGVDLDGTRIVLAHHDGKVYALHDECSHEEFALSNGELGGGQITCILHGARFDLETGAPRALPAVRPVRTYECRVAGDEVQVRLD
ncbi:MAG: non-heme iron oxygenase ferredoxin subunit [Gemmatimonadota bacterium]